MLKICHNSNEPEPHGAIQHPRGLSERHDRPACDASDDIPGAHVPDPADDGTTPAPISMLKSQDAYVFYTTKEFKGQTAHSATPRPALGQHGAMHLSGIVAKISAGKLAEGARFDDTMSGAENPASRPRVAVSEVGSPDNSPGDRRHQDPFHYEIDAGKIGRASGAHAQRNQHRETPCTQQQHGAEDRAMEASDPSECRRSHVHLGQPGPERDDDAG